MQLGPQIIALEQMRNRAQSITRSLSSFGIHLLRAKIVCPLHSTCLRGQPSGERPLSPSCSCSCSWWPIGPSAGEHAQHGSIHQGAQTWSLHERDGNPAGQTEVATLALQATKFDGWRLVWSMDVVCLASGHLGRQRQTCTWICAYIDTRADALEHLRAMFANRRQLNSAQVAPDQRPIGSRLAAATRLAAWLCRKQRLMAAACWVAAKASRPPDRPFWASGGRAWWAEDGELGTQLEPASAASRSSLIEPALEEGQSQSEPASWRVAVSLLATLTSVSGAGR